MRNVGLANPTQAQTGERDAELSRGKRGIEVLRRAQSEFYAPAALFGERPKLAGANLYECKFSCDEKTIGGDKEEDDESFERNTQEGRHAWPITIGGLAGRASLAFEHRALPET